jgi:hypothetical protein
VVAKGEEAGVIGFRISQREATLAQRLLATDQDASVIEGRIAGAEPPPVIFDERAIVPRPRPLLLREARLDRGDGRDHDVREFGHPRSVPSLITTASPPISAETRAPSRMTI